MRQSDDVRQSDSVVGRGIGAGVIALLAALGRQADDVARFAGRQAGNLGRGAFQQADDLGRVVLYGSDDLLRGADDVTRPWTLPGDRMIEPRCIVTASHAEEPAGDRGGAVLWHLARKTGEETLKLAIEHDKGDE